MGEDFKEKVGFNEEGEHLKRGKVHVKAGNLMG